MARALGFLSHALFFTLWQASLSAAAALLLGLVAAPGFARLRGLRKYARALLLFPNLLSPILVVLGVLVSFKNFPYGLSGIIAGHVFMNVGLATVWLGEKWRDLETRFAPTNQVLGGSSFLFFRKVILPQMRAQFLSAFAVIFALCTASFAIPLVLGGSPSHSTLEVLLYEKLRGEGDIRGAIMIGLLQAFIQLMAFVILLRPESFQNKNTRPLTVLPQFSAWSLATLSVLFISLFPIVKISALGFSHFAQLQTLATQSEFRTALGFSLVTAVSVALLLFLSLGLLVTFGWPAWLTRVPALSGVVIGLGLLLLSLWLPSSQSPLTFYGLLLVGHFLVIFFPVFRLAQNRLLGLRRNYSQALRQLDAGGRLAFKKIYFPLGWGILFGSAALGGLWSLGEFSVSRLVSGQWITFPILTENLISAYRLEAAAAASLLFLGFSLVSLVLIERLSHGLD